MQIQRIDQKTAFNANIIKTPYLEAGVKYARDSAPLREANNFLNALTLIKNDKNMKTFKIDKIEQNARKGSQPCSNIEVDGNLVPCNIWGSVSEGLQCFLAITTFVKQCYGGDILDRTRSKKYQELLDAEHRAQCAFEAARNEMQTSLDNII